MSLWLVILVAPFVTSAGVMLAALAGVPAMIAALALVPLVFGIGLVWAATMASLPAGFFAAAMVGAILGTVLSKRQRADQRG
jgi:uncharacterized membrane protein YiaA